MRWSDKRANNIAFARVIVDAGEHAEVWVVVAGERRQATSICDLHHGGGCKPTTICGTDRAPTGSTCACTPADAKAEEITPLV